MAWGDDQVSRDGDVRCPRGVTPSAPRWTKCPRNVTECPEKVTRCAWGGDTKCPGERTKYLGMVTSNALVG